MIGGVHAGPDEPDRAVTAYRGRRRGIIETGAGNLDRTGPSRRSILGVEDIVAVNRPRHPESSDSAVHQLHQGRTRVLARTGQVMIRRPDSVSVGLVENVKPSGCLCIPVRLPR